MVYSRKESPIDRMEMAKKAYDFFCQKEQEQHSFRLEELQRATGYAHSTAKGYRSKIWAKFLTVCPDGSFTCHDLLLYPKERFLDLHRQKRDPDSWLQLQREAPNERTFPPSTKFWAPLVHLLTVAHTVIRSFFLR